MKSSQPKTPANVPSAGVASAGSPDASSVAEAKPMLKSRPSRVVVENVQPQVDHGKFPIKRVVYDEVAVSADVFTEGHDLVSVVLRCRQPGSNDWAETPMRDEGNDRWTGAFQVTHIGRGEYTVEAWINRFASWRRELGKKFDAGQDVHSELLEGAELVRQASHRAASAGGGAAKGAERLREFADVLGNPTAAGDRVHSAQSDVLKELMDQYAERVSAQRFEPALQVVVDVERARFGSWYEVFPRSCSPDPNRHGTFQDLIARLPYIADMGFDVLYLPPIHPIGVTHRKGPNNTLVAGPGDPGSPWGIGSKEGGHKSVHPDLGTLEDFDRVVSAAKARQIEIALDIAFQCSPDHPYVKQHPEWFRHRPDGTIKYAENPPKKYQDIYPIDFECEAWESLWNELLDVFLFWCRRGVRVYRVDNPHTKPFRFWEWVIAQVKEVYPETIFLSEAFTRPKVMHFLAKAGFTQSYTYFTWRNTKQELTHYIHELSHGPGKEYMRPNLFANTPDILHEYLQVGGRPAFQIRAALAATLGASYGIYGPGYEACEGRGMPKSEEYLDSEKYQVRYWDWYAQDSLRGFLTRLNQIRKSNPALQNDATVKFLPVENDQLLFYAKCTPDQSNLVLTIVNLDPHWTQSGWVHVPLSELGLPQDEPYQVHDLMSDARYLWHGSRNFVELNPHACPVHIFRVRRRIGTERDFDYYM